MLTANWRDPRCPKCDSPYCDFLIGQTCYAEYGTLFGLDAKQTHAVTSLAMLEVRDYFPLISEESAKVLVVQLLKGIIPNYATHLLANRAKRWRKTLAERNLESEQSIKREGLELLVELFEEEARELRRLVDGETN